MTHTDAENAEVLVALSITDGPAKRLRCFLDLLVSEVRRIAWHEFARSLPMETELEMTLAINACRNFQLVAITPCALARCAFAHESISTFGVHTRRMHEGAHDVLTLCNQLRLVAHALPRSRTAYLVDGRFRPHAVGRCLNNARNRRSRERLLFFRQRNFDGIPRHTTLDEDGLPFGKMANRIGAVCHSLDYDGMVHGGVNPLLQIDLPAHSSV